MAGASLPTQAAADTVWEAHARQWRWLGSPLRPAPEDITFVERAVFDWYDRAHPHSVQALLLGVTPELSLMEWPAATHLTALDRSPHMIGAVWPGAPLGQSAVRGLWTALPLWNRSQHVAVGDGCLVLLPRAAHTVFFSELRRVLHDDGLLVLRVFTRPEAAEPVAVVVDDLLQDRIDSIHVFKWRLAMALHGTPAEGVRLSAVWDAWQAAVPDVAVLARRLHWRRDSMDTLTAYRDSETRYTFPTLTELRGAFAPCFEEAACLVPEYTLGERCPTLVLRPR